MKLSLINKITAGALIAIMALAISSCVKDKFASPPVITATDPSGMVANMTLQQFKIRYCFQHAHVYDSIRPVLIDDSIILSGVINADDKSGNFYKQMVFQDSTGGLQLKVDATGLYNEYPIGRKIFVKCKGLYIYNYLGTLELGSYIDTTTSQPGLGGIPSSLISKFVVKGTLGNTVTPKKYSIILLNATDLISQQSTLVSIDSVQFTKADTGLTYSDPFNKAFGNITFIDTLRNSAVVRSSGFADFANVHVSKNNGSLTGIFTIYQKSNGTYINQVGIRDTNDVAFNMPYRRFEH